MMFNRPSRFALAAATLLSSLSALSGCTVGPDYHGAPPVARDARSSASFVRAPAAGTTATPAPNEWWLAFNDPQLNDLIAAAFAQSPDVHIAQARLRESRSQLQRQRANALPKVSGYAAAPRLREPDLSALRSGSSSGSSAASSGRGPLQLYTAGFDASWEIDLFGGDPSAMLQQRPDIRAAERRLASSNAQIGEHIADFFPKVTLFGSIGFSAGDPGHLVRKSNFSWIAAPYLQWNAIDFGRTLGSVHAAEASRDEAEARYTKTVLGALQDANSSLSRYGHQREHVVTLQKVEASASHSATLMRQRYAAGVATLIDLLDTQRQEFTAQQNVVAGQAELLKDFVSLQKSLGIGWQAQQAWLEGATSPALKAAVCRAT